MRMAGWAVPGVMAVLLSAAPAPGEYPRDEMQTEQAAKETARLDAVLQAADSFAQAAGGRTEEEREKLFAGFYSGYGEARRSWENDHGIRDRRWALISKDREKELGLINARVSWVGWTLRATDKPYHYSLEEDSGWLLSRFGPLLSASWREYLPEAEKDAIAGYDYSKRSIITGRIDHWESFLLNHRTFPLADEVRAIIRRYQESLIQFDR